MSELIRDDDLVSLAEKARVRSYSPYSNISVGAALLAKSGRVYVGANIENASYTPTVCAERVAFFKAISEGEREFSAIAIVGASTGSAPTKLFTPCGVCRQVMSEFCGPDFKVLVFDGEKTKEYLLSELFPYGFSREALN